MASNVASDLKTYDMAYLRKLQALIQQEIASRTPKKYTSILNEICQRHSRYFHVTYAYVPNKVICKFVIHYDNVTCTYDAYATGPRRDAKENASILVYNMICNNACYKQITDNANVDASRIAHAEHQLDVELGCVKRPLGCAVDDQKNHSASNAKQRLDNELDSMQENIAKYHDIAAASSSTATTFAMFAKQQLDDELDSIQENIAKHHTAVESPRAMSQQQEVYSDSESINISDDDNNSSTDTTDDDGFAEIM